MANDNLNARLEALLGSVAEVINLTAPVNDTDTSHESTWSAAQIISYVEQAVSTLGKTDTSLSDQIGKLSELLQTDGTALDQLQRLISTPAGSVRVDAAQSFTPAEQAQALVNLGINASAFFVDVDLAAIFASKLKNSAFQAAATPAPAEASAPAAPAS